MTISESLILAVLGICFMGGIILQMVFNSFLKHNHEDVWIKLGSPSLIYNNSLKNMIAVYKYLWKKEYKKINDKKLHHLADFTLYYSLGYETNSLVHDGNLGSGL